MKHDGSRTLWNWRSFPHNASRCTSSKNHLLTFALWTSRLLLLLKMIPPLYFWKCPSRLATALYSLVEPPSQFWGLPQCCSFSFCPHHRPCHLRLYQVGLSHTLCSLDVRASLGSSRCPALLLTSALMMYVFHISSFLFFSLSVHLLSPCNVPVTVLMDGSVSFSPGL